ncbi:MAG: hypothetical protein Q4A65_01880 [Bacillota bacterium]|nr:hypothetical protein [Bacillota bacterium]
MSIQKKLKNFYTFYYLMRMPKSFDRSPAVMKEEQNRNIHKLMKRAYEIPFYRKRFEASGTTPDEYHCSEDLTKFPLLTKPELRLWMQEEWENHPEIHDSVNVLSTSGSSGTPLKVLYSQREQAFSDANWIRGLSVGGYKPLRGKMYSFQTSHKDPNPKGRDSIIQSLGFMRRKVVSEDYCVGDGVGDTIRDINEYKPDMLCFRRNCLVRIVAYAEQHDMPLWKPKYYVPVSEMVDDVTRNLLTKGLGPGLIDEYGITEMGSSMYKYPGNDYFNVCHDMAVVNIYDDQNQLADNGRIIITALYKKDYPLINYDVLDLATSYVKDGLRYVTKIEGRMNDLVKHEDGVESSALMLMRIANHTVGLAQFRFVEESYHDMLIQLVRDPMNTSKSKEEIEQHFIHEVQKLYGDEFDIRIEWLDVLPPDKTGKQRCFVCNVK